MPRGPACRVAGPPQDHSRTPRPTLTLETFPCILTHPTQASESAHVDDAMEVDRAVSLEDTSLEMSRRSAAFSGLAAAVAANISLPIGAAVAAEPAKKVVAVPYTPYQVQSDSSEEAILVAKSLKAAGARLYGAFWCENCNKQKELLGKQAMEYINYVECFPNGVYQNSPDGREDVTKPDSICEGYTSAWPLWVVPKGGDESGDEIGVQGKINKPKELERLIREAKGDKFDALAYFTSGGDGYVTPDKVDAK